VTTQAVVLTYRIAAPSGDSLGPSYQEVDATHPLPVTLSDTGSITGTVILDVGGPIGATGAVVPADALAIGFSNAGGSLTIPSAANPLPVVLEPGGTTTVVGEGTAGSPAGGVLSVQGVSGGTAQPVSGTVTVLQATATPSAATASSITTGGTATTLASGPWKALFITNPLSASDQNISTAEALYINFVTTATANGRGSNILLNPGDSFTAPGVAAGVTLSAIAATTGHSVSIEVWT
jgi:hypothetical protein